MGRQINELSSTLMNLPRGEPSENERREPIYDLRDKMRSVLEARRMGFKSLSPS